MPAPTGLPAWLVTLIVAGILIGGGAAALSFFKGGPSRAEPATKAETPGKGTVVNPYAKSIEIAGVRVAESPKQQLEVKLAVINHSYAELPNVKLEVALRVANAPASQAPIATFIVPVNGLGPFEVRDIKVTTTTKLRVYELPDWQFLKADFTVAP